MSTGARDPDFATAWAALAVPWQVALELAWQACVSGTIGVGTVITDPDGTIVAQGRNSVWDGPRGEGLLRGTRLAHAEMNAFAEVPTERSLEQCTLWSTQQPCIVCAAASVMAGVGNIRFLTADPFFAGVERLPDLNPWIAEGWPRYDGPTTDQRWELAAMILHLYAAATRNPDGQVMALSRQVESEAVSVIESIVAECIWLNIAAAGGTVADALRAAWPSVLDAAARRAQQAATTNEAR